jgi:hypothetical protein
MEKVIDAWKNGSLIQDKMIEMIKKG